MAIDEKPNRSTGLRRDRREETSLVTSEPLDEKSLLVSSFFWWDVADAFVPSGSHLTVVANPELSN